MVAKRAYKRVSVNKIDRERLVEAALEFGELTTVLGLDVAKHEIVACLRWGQDNFERPWSVANPTEIGVLVEMCQLLKSRCDGFTVALESTGTYGDAVRFALTQGGITVKRVSGKAVSDYHEIFDGVPSQHDGKDAAIIAELVAHGKGVLWPYSELSENEQTLKLQVEIMDAFSKQKVQWQGRLEAMLARHWPEATAILDVSSVALLTLLEKYGSPANASTHSDLPQELRRWGRSRLSEASIASLVSSAGSTTGLPMTAADSRWMQEIAQECLRCHRKILECEASIKSVIANCPEMQRLAPIVGAGTLAVIWTVVGDPAEYSSAGAFLKAMGLNLKERSSGKRAGQLAISKRGPSLVRRWLFFWALRAVQRNEIKDWYEGFKQVGSKDSQAQPRKMKALIALMRKLSRALWHVRTYEEDFDYSKVLQNKPKRRRRRRRRVVERN